MKKVLLTTIHRPLGIENSTCTRYISSEVYHPQITFEQGPFSIRVHCTGWGLDFIASNLETPTTVLHYPTQESFIKELKKGYDYVGISFVTCTFPKAVELSQRIRTYAPQSKIVLGGYGTVLKECDQYADYVCREEGANFFRRLLGEGPIDTYKIPIFKRSARVMSVHTHLEAIIPTGLGCSRGCDFCCTSHFFERQYYPLIKTGREIHEVITSIDFGQSASRKIGMIDEDFLWDRKKIMEMARLNAQEIQKPIFFSCLSSLQSLSQYSVLELVAMGLSGVWIGIESKKADYAKLKNIDAPQMIASLKKAGVNVLASMIIGYDWHDEAAIEEDFQYLLSLKPVISQLMLYSPCPQTPFYSKLKKANRLLSIPFIHHDGFHALFKHPILSSQRLEFLLLRLLRREYEELGPSVFRILEVQLMGYRSFKDSPLPLLRARAREHKRLCFEIYPLLKIGIQKAPSLKVKHYLEELKEKVRGQFDIKIADRFKSSFARVLYFYTKMHDKFLFLNQPRTEIHRYYPNLREA